MREFSRQKEIGLFAVFFGVLCLILEFFGGRYEKENSNRFICRSNGFCRIRHWM